MGAALAIYRCVHAIRNSYKNKHGMTGNGWTENIEGYCAEIAVSKALDAYYGGGEGFKNADVMTAVQVRWITKDNYRLIVRSADNTNDDYVLVSGAAPDFTIKGYIEGKEAKSSKYLDNPGNDRPDAWFVPQSDLKPIQGLIAKVKESK